MPTGLEDIGYFGPLEYATSVIEDLKELPREIIHMEGLPAYPRHDYLEATRKSFNERTIIYPAKNATILSIKIPNEATNIGYENSCIIFDYKRKKFGVSLNSRISNEK